MEIISLPNKKFQVIKRSSLHSGGEWMNSLRTLTERQKNIKRNQSELKNKITEVKNTLEGINNGLRDAVEQVSNQKDKVIEII